MDASEASRFLVKTHVRLLLPQSQRKRRLVVQFRLTVATSPPLRASSPQDDRIPGWKRAVAKYSNDPDALLLKLLAAPFLLLWKRLREGGAPSCFD